MIGLTRGKFTYICHKDQSNVGKQTNNIPYIDGIGLISNNFHPFPLGRSQVHLLLPSLGPSSALGLFHSKQRTLGDWVTLVRLHTKITGKAYVRKNPPPKLPYKVQYLHFRVAEILGDHWDFPKDLLNKILPIPVSQVGLEGFEESSWDCHVFDCYSHVFADVLVEEPQDPQMSPTGYRKMF